MKMAHGLGLGRPPWRIDILLRIDGKSFADAWKNRIEGELFGVTVPDQDLLDVKNLRKFS